MGRARARLPIVLTPLGEVELTNAFHLRVFRKELTLSEMKQALALVREDFAAGVLSSHPFPAAAFGTAIRISRSHTTRLGTRTLEILHVASALTLQTSELYTFDHAQRRLARAEGLACS